MVVNVCNPNTQEAEGRRVVSLNAARVEFCQKYTPVYTSIHHDLSTSEKPEVRYLHTSQM